MDHDLTKEQLYKLMANSKAIVSFADQENFGFSTLEAATLGCALVLPDKVVYPEFYPQSCLYNGLKECEDKLTKIMVAKKEPQSVCKTKRIPFKFEKSIKRMCEVMDYDKRR